MRYHSDCWHLCTSIAIHGHFSLDRFLARSGTRGFGELRVHGSASDTVRTVFGSFRTDSLGCNLTSPVPSDLFGTVEFFWPFCTKFFFFFNGGVL